MKRAIFLLAITAAVYSSFAQEDRDFVELKPVAMGRMPEELAGPIFGDMVVDAAGNIFDLDSRQCQVHKFSADLKYLKSFGRKGQGPGEFSHAYDISMDGRGIVYVHDAPARLLRFTGDGQYLDEVNLAKEFGYVSDVQVLGENVAVGKRHSPQKQGIIFRLRPLEVLTSCSLESTDVKAGIGSGVMVITGPGFGDQSAVIAAAGMAVMMQSAAYRFALYDAAGKRLWEVHKPEIERRKFSFAEKAFISSMFQKAIERNPRVKEMVDGLEYKNVLEDVLFSGEHIFIFPVRDDLTVRNFHPVDIYDLKGRLVKKAIFRDIPLLVWKNIAISVSADAQENLSLVKSEMKW